MLSLLTVFTLRFVCFSENKIMILLVLMMWIIGENKLTSESVAWSLVLPFYAATLFVGSTLWNSTLELIMEGFTKHWINILCEGWVLTGVLFVFTYHLVRVTSFLRMKIKNLEETQKRMEQAMAARNTFMSHVSHEFRCPIMSSMGCLELLKQTNLSESQNQLVDTVSESNSVLLMLIEDILQLIKIEYENKEVGKRNETEGFQLEDCLKSLKNIVMGYANQFNVSLRFFIQDELQKLAVQSSRSRIHQILSNLLTNAIKVSPPNSIVELHCEKVVEEVENTEEGVTWIAFRVVDHGVGIPQSKLKEIFEPFVQLHNTNESKFPR